jgi:ketosteroid isomerase-like protein
MSSSEPDVPIFAAMLRSALGDRLSESATFPAMLAENVEIEHPYAHDGPLRIVGRAALVAHMRDALARFTVEHAATRYVYHCEPRGAVVVEFDLVGHRLPSGKEYKQQCVAIIETSGGRITRFREYWNPLNFAPESS